MMSDAMPLTAEPRSHFVGFHDIIPWSPSQKRFLCLEADESAKRGSLATVGVIDLDDPELRFEPVSETPAWTWHIGSRQQWFDDETIMYNAVLDGRHHAVLHNVDSGQTREIDGGLWDIAESRDWGLAPSFARSDRYYSSYGFHGGTAPSLDDPAPDDDGLYLIDIASGRRVLRFSVREMVDLLYPGEPKDGGKAYWLSHPTFNTDASRFTFFLRHRRSDGSLHSDFMVADREDGPPRCLVRGLVSHFDWFDADTLLVYARRMGAGDALRDGIIGRNRLFQACFSTAKALRARLPRRRGSAREGAHLVIDVRTGHAQVLAPELLVVDAHQQFTKDNAWMVYDSYPDPQGDQHLYLMNMRTLERIGLGTYPEASRLINYKKQIGVQNRACNLHPRWNRAGDAVCFDWANDRSRQVYALDVSGIVDAG